MSKTEILVLWLLNLLAGVGAALWLRHYFAPAVREQRRRDRSSEFTAARVVEMKTHQWCAAIGLALALAKLTALAGNLVPNGSFEEAQKADPLAGMDAKTRSYYAGTRQSPFEGWTFGGRWDQGDYAVPVSRDAHSDQQSCQITCVRKGRAGSPSFSSKRCAQIFAHS